MLHHILNRYPLHSINFNFWIISSIQCIRNRINCFFVNLGKSVIFRIISVKFVNTCIIWIARPGPVNNFLWQTWHLKCLAFWCWIRTASSSNSLLQYQHHGFTNFLFFRPIFYNLKYTVLDDRWLLESKTLLFQTRRQVLHYVTNWLLNQ